MAQETKSISNSPYKTDARVNILVKELLDLIEGVDINVVRVALGIVHSHVNGVTTDHE